MTESTLKYLYVELPYPISEIENENFNIDNYSQLLEEKQKFKEWAYKLSQRNLDQYEHDINKRIVNLSRSIVKICNNEIRDPDPYFDHTFNWYYCGGILDSLYFGDSQYLVQPDFNGNINLLYFNKKTDLEAINVINTNDIKPIYNITCNKFQDCWSIAARKKFSAALYFIHNLDEITNDTWYLDSRTPIVDFRVSPFNKRQVVALDVEHVLKIYDVGKKKHKETLLMTERSNGFGQIDIVDDNNVVCVNDAEIKFIDVRTGTITHNIVNNIDTNSCLRCFNDKIVVMTCLNIMQVDRRNNNFVTVFPHNMSCTPFISKPLPNGMNHFIVAGHTQKLIVDLDNHTVQEIPSTRDTLFEAQCELSYKLSFGMKKRLKCPTVGVVPITDQYQRELQVYSCNSVGDTFRQRCSNSKSYDIKIEYFSTWIDDIKDPSPPLYHTGLVNNADAKYLLKSDISPSVDEKYEKTENISNLTAPVVYESNNFGAYLSQTWEDAAHNREPLVEIPPERKVSNWLNSSFKGA